MEELGLQEYFRFLLALIFVLGLFAFIILLARRYGVGQRMPMRSGRSKRLNLVEVMALDGKRRMVLVQRDHTEHLIILGPHGDTVVEAGIIPGLPSNFAQMVEDSGGSSSPS